MLLWSGITASMSAKKIDPVMKRIVNTIRKELQKRDFLRSDNHLFPPKLSVT
jgi:hypothetical protein